jgi:hypothetical protein
VSGGTGVTSFSPTLSQTTQLYAQARNTTANCVSSSRLVVTGTVDQYGAEGSAPGTCGCASCLTNCSGTCTASCHLFTACSGFTEVYVVLDKKSGQQGASQVCQAHGTSWRLPTIEELQCLCVNRLDAEIPDGDYWSSTSPGSSPLRTSFPTCQTQALVSTYNINILCVR